METVTEGRVEGHKENDDSKFDANDIDYEAILSRPRRRGLRRTTHMVEEAPEFIKRLNPFEEVKAGDTVVFQCQWKAFPKPTVKWYKDDEEIVEDNRYSVSEENDGNLALTIKQSCKKDEGAFKCKVENQEGVASTTGYLSVSGDVSEKTLAAQSRNHEPVVSLPPHLRTIVEQQSVEEREGEETSNLPPSPIQDFLDRFRRGKSWPIMMAIRKSLCEPGDDEDYEDSSSDTSVDSQDFDRVTIHIEEQNDANTKKTAQQNLDNHNEPRHSEIGITENTFIIPEHVERAESQPITHSRSAPAHLSNLKRSKSVKYKIRHYDIPWLYYFGIISFATFFASSTNISPMWFILMMLVISLVSFQFLPKPRKK